ncbi:hypothetical protein RN001_009612 [Aquatica leii]|uniref:Uncharacterized protein n=1 Tax=Aquatica leii TaxID=1421715 RepID=A0AAN7P867_9COLE|nr:hypothetical protein RN001_009612 [Aquatica leii]
MALKLYSIGASPPARAVIITAAAVGVELDVITVERDYLYTDEFLKLNPQHTVPVLIDEDKIICDSHVIVTYLIQKYAKDDLLYPSSLSKRIVVDQRLYYDASIMFPIVKKAYSGFRSKEFKEIPNELKIAAVEVYDIFEKYLTKTEWLAGDHITVADISSMVPKLYIIKESPPSRAVIITAAAIELQLDIVVVDGNYLRTDEFLKLNPQHTVPVLVDDDNIICDSHVIATYLIRKYAKNDLLYSSNLTKRSLVDQRLYYDASVMFPTTIRIGRGFHLKQFKKVPSELADNAIEIYGILETYLGKTEWLAGDHLTVADIFCYVTVKSLNVAVPYDLNKFVKLASWMDKLHQVSYVSVDEPYFKAFVDVFEAVLKS